MLSDLLHFFPTMEGKKCFEHGEGAPRARIRSDGTQEQPNLPQPATDNQATTAEENVDRVNIQASPGEHETAGNALAEVAASNQQALSAVECTAQKGSAEDNSTSSAGLQSGLHNIPDCPVEEKNNHVETGCRDELVGENSSFSALSENGPSHHSTILRRANTEQSICANILANIAECVTISPKVRKRDISSSLNATEGKRIKSAKSVKIAEETDIVAFPCIDSNPGGAFESQKNGLRELKTPPGTNATSSSMVSPRSSLDGLAMEQKPLPKLHKPCLKRGTSCFIRPPDSLSRKVTFERPKSVADIRRRTDTEENIDQDSVHDSHKDPIKIKSLGFNTTNDPEDPSSSADDSAVVKYTERNGIVPHRQGNRPFSSGSTVRRNSPESTFPQRTRLRRLQSFHVDRQEAMAKAQLPTANSNLPKSAAFLVRRDSVLNKSLIPKGCGSAPGTLTQELEINTTKEKAAPFETYIIRNCRLLRRSSSSLRILNSGHSSGGTPRSANDVKDKSSTYREVGNSSSTRFHGLYHETTSGISEGTALEDTDTEEQPLSCRQVHSAHSSNRSGTALVDGKGETCHWDSKKQAIVPGPSDETPELQATGVLVQRTTVQDEVEITQEMQEELQKLGFRKPTKSKKNKAESGRSGEKDKKEPANTSNEPQRTVINLQEDPMLVQIRKKNKNVGKFTCKPEPRPHAVCFELLGTSLTHREVKRQVEKLLATCPEVKIESILFHHRALVNNEVEMNNRWIVTTNSLAGRNRLAGNNLNFAGEVVQLRRYDDVVNTEYQQFVRMSNFIKMMNNRKILG